MAPSGLRILGSELKVDLVTESVVRYTPPPATIPESLTNTATDVVLRVGQEFRVEV